MEGIDRVGRWRADRDMDAAVLRDRRPPRRRLSQNSGYFLPKPTVAARTISLVRPTGASTAS